MPLSRHKDSRKARILPPINGILETVRHVRRENTFYPKNDRIVVEVRLLTSISDCPAIASRSTPNLIRTTEIEPRYLKYLVVYFPSSDAEPVVSVPRKDDATSFVSVWNAFSRSDLTWPVLYYS